MGEITRLATGVTIIATMGQAIFFTECIHA